MQPEDIEVFVHAVPLPVVVIGAAQTLLAVNDPARRLLGDHIIGRHYITALRQPGLLEIIETVAQTGQERNGVYLSEEAGRDTTFEVHICPAGQSLVLTFIDMSAQEEAGQMRRDFVANVSHELRTPLTALLGFIETLRGNARGDPDAQERFLSIMEREANRMTQIVEDLLSLSRVEAEQRVRPMEQVGIASVVASTLAELEPLIEASSVEVQFADQSDGQTIPADPAQIGQVLSNLIVNALKYAGTGERIDISLSAPTDEKRLRARGVRLTVQDYGEGIAEHHLARLTERFYRVDSHRSRAVGGTGLGLAIVKHIINRHRGRFEIESVLGKGTKATVILPLS